MKQFKIHLDLSMVSMSIIIPMIMKQMKNHSSVSLTKQILKIHNIKASK